MQHRVRSHTAQGTRFSALRQITAGNVAGLRQVWTFATGTEAGREG